MKSQPNNKLFVFNDRGNILYFPSERQLKRFIQCHRKAKLTNISANSIVKKAKESGRLLSVYLCPVCKHWHLTHKKQ